MRGEVVNAEGSVDQVGDKQQAEANDSHRAPILRRILPWLFRGLGLLVLVGLGFLGVDILGALELMLDVRPWYLASAFVVFCLALAGRMIVWIILARALKLGYKRLRNYVRLYLIGWSVALGLPQGASPLARAAVLASDKRSVGRGAVVDIADRLLHVATFLVLLVVSSAYLSAESTRVLTGVVIGVVIIAAATPLVLLGAWLLRPLWRRILAFGWARTFMEDFATALEELRRTPPRLLARLLTLAMVPSLLSVTSLFLASRALDIPLSYPVLMAAFAAVSLTIILPISINGLGPREGIFTVAVAGAGFNSEAGVALGLLWFLMQAATRLAAAAAWFINSAEDEVPATNQTEVETDLRASS